MAHQEASAVIAYPLATIRDRLRDVESWACVVLGLDRVSRTGHERYVFTISDGRRERDVPVVAKVLHGEQCMVWRETSGPRFSGSLRLAEVDPGRTRVTLSVTEYPAGFLAGIGDMLAPQRARAQLDLQRLEDHLRAAAT